MNSPELLVKFSKACGRSILYKRHLGWNTQPLRGNQRLLVPWKDCLQVTFVIVIADILFRNVMNHMSHHFNLFEATHFVLSGTSAGGFGVRDDKYQ